jgi:sortase A
MRTRRWIENALLIVGLIALDVWIWSNGSRALYEGWENWVFNQELHHQPANLAQFWAEKREQIAAEASSWLGFIVTPHRAPAARPASPSVAPPVVAHNGLVGRLTIPRLHISAMVREGAGEDTLSLALGHIPRTALPGQPGNVGIAGHRDELFRGLRNIRRDDLIAVETLAGRYVYRVESTSIVRPRDVDVLHAGPHPELTLVTCYPFYYVGSAPERFIVKAREVHDNSQIADGAGNSLRRAGFITSGAR